MIIKAFFGGMFIFNSIPHLVKGIAGQTHMTPFKRVSSPILNVLWAFANLLFGALIMGLDSSGRLDVLSGNNFWAFVVGGFIMALMNASLFGKPDARLPWHKD
jgi:hypothetical protein